MAFLSKRRITPEHMDDPSADRDELRRSLRFLARLNRRLGGVDPIIRHLQEWASSWPDDRAIRVLDVGTGGADIPLAIADWARRRGTRVEIVGVDMHETTLSIAREHVGDRDDIELVCADATTLTDRFEADSFDYAHASLFLHHLSDLQVMTVLRMMQRLARHAVVWNDLVRGPVGRLGARLLTLGASPMARHDARVSVEAAFTKRETLDLATRVGLENVRYHQHFFYRFTLTSMRDDDQGP
jgi:ubiquinone/menaquinone biosynthesis C-methylase UbiE